MTDERILDRLITHLGGQVADLRRLEREEPAAERNAMIANCPEDLRQTSS